MSGLAEDRGRDGPRRWLASATLALTALALAHALWTAWRASWTDDERMHLAWSERLVEDGITERSSHELYNSKTPISVPNVLARDAAAALGATPHGQRFAARLPTVAWLAALWWASFALGRRIFGADAACLAVCALALEPNLIAHGSLVTVDAAFAFGVVWLVWRALAFAHAPTAASGAWLGAAVAFALTAKYTALLIVPLAVALPFALRLPFADTDRPRRRALALGLLVAAAVAWGAICATYGFVGVGAAGELEWESGAMAWLAKPLYPLFAALPADFVSGIDQVIADERGQAWNVVLFTTRYPDGVWFYFPVLWLVKTPLALLAATVVGCVAVAREARLRSDRPRWMLLGVAAVGLAYFCWLFRVQVGYRFVLFCLPLVALGVASAWARLLESRRGIVALTALAAIALVEQAPFAGNSLAFTNAFVSNRTAYRVVADSNLDWGQNDERAAAWARDHLAHLNPHHVLPGSNLIGGSYLAGVFSAWRVDWLTWRRDPDGERFRTHFLFELDDAEFSQYLDEARTVDPMASASCVLGESARRTSSAGEAIALDLGRGGSLDLCVVVGARADISMRVRDRSRVGVRDSRGGCVADDLFAHQQAWFRLPPGSYRLCATGRGVIGLHVERGSVDVGRP